MREKMEKYSYGPLVFNTTIDDDDSGNFYWNGLPPVGYDDMNVPVDERGMQCLPLACPLHPSFVPENLEYNEWLDDDLPALADFQGWFDDNFISVPERDYYFYIIRWYSLQDGKNTNLIAKAGSKSLDEMIDLAWPNAPKS